MTKLHMRAATLADIPRLAEIWAIAFLNDPFYNAIFPHRSEFLVDYHKMWVTKLQKRFLQPGDWYIVVEVDVVDASGRPRKEIAGWASWKRMGSSKAAEKAAADNHCFLKGIEGKLFELEESFIHPILRFIQRYPGDRFADSEALEMFYKEYATYMDGYWIGDVEEHWHLKMLGVDPKWQRNGVGRVLTQWGLERAREEGVPAGLEASEAGGPMYLKLGFVEVERFLMLDGRAIFPILLWRPENDQGGGKSG